MLRSHAHVLLLIRMFYSTQKKLLDFEMIVWPEKNMQSPFLRISTVVHSLRKGPAQETRSIFIYIKILWCPQCRWVVGHGTICSAKLTSKQNYLSYELMSILSIQNTNLLLSFSTKNCESLAHKVMPCCLLISLNCAGPRSYYLCKSNGKPCQNNPTCMATEWEYNASSTVNTEGHQIYSNPNWPLAPGQ